MNDNNVDVVVDYTVHALDRWRIGKGAEDPHIGVQLRGAVEMTRAVADERSLRLSRLSCWPEVLLPWVIMKFKAPEEFEGNMPSDVEGWFPDSLGFRRR